jgi:hypothetical protein
MREVQYLDGFKAQVEDGETVLTKEACYDRNEGK